MDFKRQETGTTLQEERKAKRVLRLFKHVTFNRIESVWKRLSNASDESIKEER